MIQCHVKNCEQLAVWQGVWNAGLEKGKNKVVEFCDGCIFFKKDHMIDVIRLPNGYNAESKFWEEFNA